MTNSKQKLMAALVVPVVLAMSGCVIVTEGDHDWDSKDGYSQRDWQEMERENRATIAGLDAGTTIESARTKLGVADFSDSLQKDDALYQVLYYRTHRVKSDGETTRDECTPLVFKNGQLIGTGQLALSSLN
ncbi:MAG: DUF3192 domain-containing protein [Idiomarina sp.]